MRDDGELERFLANARSSAASTAAAKIVRLEPHAQTAATWALATLRGRLVELSARGATATLTAAIELVVEAQVQDEPIAWIAPAAGTFYPPDVAASGVDLDALVVVRTTNAIAAARAAERLLRSGAFGLVVLDLGDAELSMQVQGRLVTLAQAHDAAVVCITDKSTDAASLGSLISLRAEATRTRDRDELALTVRALKDKRRGPGWTHVAKRGAPSGLR
jgi:recombination protein RecA